MLNDDLFNRLITRWGKPKLTHDELIAANLMWRKDPRLVPILAKALGCSKNTLYYRAITGHADSYPASGSEADRINREVDKIIALSGSLKQAIAEHVPDSIADAVNAEVARRVQLKENAQS